jgi:alkanesulfonate monooxygenase SsuD/methylene tetrahydromethanopterin reductase-like flavin-dependent oxidoreductase (luciferase family)
MDELRSLWQWLDGRGFDWISAWDHIYEAPPAGGTVPHFEAVATLAAMAADTTNARLGCLVFYVGYRNPGLLAKSAITIDHLSHGRFELGLGGGWHEWEARAYGYDFPGVGSRLDMLAEATELIADLVNGPARNRPRTEVSPTSDSAGDRIETSGPSPDAVPRSSFHGRHFRLEDASCLPPPVHGSMPIWIGGIGEIRTLPIAARWADGWNAAYLSAAEFARLNRRVDQLCEDAGRDPDDVERSVNVMFGLGLDQAHVERTRYGLEQAWGPLADRVADGAVLGTPDQAVEQLASYVEAGADMVNIAIRHPFEPEALAAYHEVVMPALRAMSR